MLLDTYDFNIEIYHDVSEREHKFWGDEYGGSWDNPEFVINFVQRNRVAIEKRINQIAEKKYSVVCFSVNSTSRLFSEYFASQLKQQLPNAKIVFGGPDCFRSENGTRYLLNSSIDYICVGEGDLALPSLLNELSLDQIIQTHGIVTRGANGDLLDNGDPELVEDLDMLPFPDYSWANPKKYTIANRITTMTSRGCINRCAFCSEGMNFKKFRTRSPQNVLAELEGLRSWFTSRHGNFVNFNDSLINGDMDRFQEFLNLLMQSPLRVAWGSMALIRKEMDELVLGQMRRSGCVEITWGLESGSGTVLKQMGKRFDIETAKTVIIGTAKVGIKQYTNLIVGFPGEREKEFIENCLFVIQYGKYFELIGLPLMTSRRNSLVYLHPERYDVVNHDSPLEWYTKDHGNTIEIRKMRRELLQRIMGAKLFDQGKT
jgi:anaerobic magnesium-protoporphyrin IX monomethyl ester cyclase